MKRMSLIAGLLAAALSQPALATEASGRLPVCFKTVLGPMFLYAITNDTNWEQNDPVSALARPEQKPAYIYEYAYNPWVPAAERFTHNLTMSGSVIYRADGQLDSAKAGGISGEKVTGNPNPVNTVAITRSAADPTGQSWEVLRSVKGGASSLQNLAIVPCLTPGV